MAEMRPVDAGVLMEIARGLTPLQRSILFALRDKGPGALLEVAVRVLKFPEEVREPLASLREKGLVTSSERAGTGFGGEVIALTADGARLASWLRDERFLKQLEAAPALPPARTVDPRQQQVELLQKLGDLAAGSGDTDGARNYYEQALQVTQKLAEPDS